MIGYEVWLNGERLCLASVGEWGVLSTIATWVHRSDPDGTDPIEHELTIGGFATSKGEGGEHMEWIARSLAAGDEVRIKIRDIQQSEADLPRTRRLVDQEADAAAEREYYEHLKLKFENTGS